MNNILVTESQLGGEGFFSAGSEGWINGAGIITDIYNFSEELGNEGLVGEFVAGAGIVASGVSMAFNPLATGVGWAISYLMEHITPIRESLQWVTGDRDEIAAGAQTWSNISHQLTASAADVEAAARQTAEESGESATAYRAKLGQHSLALSALAASATGVANNINMIGAVVSAAYETIRDMISEAIGLFLQTVLEEVLSLGLATPIVAAQISAWVAAKAMKIKKLLDAIMNLISKCGAIGRGLTASMRGLGRLFDLPSDLAVAAGRSVGRSFVDKSDVGSNFLRTAGNSARAAGNAAEAAGNGAELVTNASRGTQRLDEGLLGAARRKDIKAALQGTDAQTRLDWLHSLPPARRHDFLNRVMRDDERRRMFLSGLSGQEQAKLISGLPSSQRDDWAAASTRMLDASPQTPQELADMLANPNRGQKWRQYHQVVDDNWRFPSAEESGALEEYLGNFATWTGLAKDEWDAYTGE
ncbi:hypothetical protein [Buchananella hordeovulneris]|uniref:hypothetical protein n=1 Tax=Buchananella hordeovulneris TaxID=52770 RepID=UPI0026DBDB18|nr:hypothetical protein [Buchananella hordeovulneris]MDO5081103.1 hypothetical protein [Buchananella hordeovulneris]